MPNDDTDVRAALVAASEAQLAQDAMTTLPTEDELRHWYADHRADYASPGMMQVDEWLLPSSTPHPIEATKTLRRGGDPTRLGARRSGRMRDGEEFYFAAQIHLGKRLFAVARSLGAGQVSDPISDRDGFHILRVIHNQPPEPIGYADVRDRVVRDFLAAKVARLQAAEDRFLRRRADIRIADDLR